MNQDLSMPPLSKGTPGWLLLLSAIHLQWDRLRWRDLRHWRRSAQALKNNRRVRRRAEAPLVRSLFSLPPLPFIRHRRRSAPSPLTLHSVWNASSATNRGNLKPYSLRSLARQISSRFSQKYFNLLKPLKYFCSPQTTLLLFGEILSPNPFLFAKL